MPDTMRFLTLLAVGCSAGLGCSSPTDGPAVGDIEVYVATTGPEPDPDGYRVRVDRASVRGLGVEDSTRYQGLESGPHAVELIDLAANCAVRGDVTQSATVTAGGTTKVRFEVVCTATGVLRVVTRSDGPADPDGYQLAVSGRGTRPIGANETITMAGLSQGTLTVELTELSARCEVDGGSARRVTLAGGDTAEVIFAVHCTPPPQGGTIHVTVSTSAVNAPFPTGYLITLDGGTSQTVGANDAIDFTRLSSGLHSVRLSGQPSWCAVGGFFGGQNPVQVMVKTDSVSTVSFGVLCLG